MSDQPGQPGRRGATEEQNPAAAVREEDAFDVGAVADWLRDHVDPAFAAVVADDPAEVRQFSGGASNLTFLLRYPRGELILRCPPPGAKAASAHDMGREHRIQRALKPVFSPVPRMVAYCGDTTVMGDEFYVMEKIAGTVPRRELPGGITPEQTSRLCRDAWDTLIALHLLDPAEVGLADLGKGQGYVARQVAGWTDRLSRAATDDLGDWSPVTAWLDEHQPADVATCLIHNDFRFDNLVLAPDDPTRIVGVLDWEMATLGDPLMDLGGSMAYWISDSDDEFFREFRRQPSNAPGMWTREQIVDYYGEQTGLQVTPEQWRFYEVFGLFRLAVIAQQIWYRYYHGQTHNEAYAVFGPAVGYLEQRCRRLLGV